MSQPPGGPRCPPLSSESIRPPMHMGLADCRFFASGGGCKRNAACPFRHTLDAQRAAQAKPCFMWASAAGCTRMECQHAHALQSTQQTQTAAAAGIGRARQFESASKRQGTQTGTKASATNSTSTSTPSLKEGEATVRVPHSSSISIPNSIPVALFWDLDNCSVPRGCDAFDLVQLIRRDLVTQPNRLELMFNAYCDATKLDRKHQVALHHANVRIQTVPTTKSGAVDLALLLDLDRFALTHRPPATIVLLSGDIDFIGKLQMLRHQQGYEVIVVHNAVAKRELKLCATQVFPFQHFTQKLESKGQIQSQQRRHDLPTKESNKQGSKQREKSETSEASAAASANRPHAPRHQCTFAQTGRQFAEQLYRPCLTCRRDGKYGICTACEASGCHEGHKLGAAQRSDFFCDCGANGPPSQVACKCLQAKPNSKSKSKSRKTANHKAKASNPTAVEGKRMNVCRLCDSEFSSFHSLVQHQSAKEHWICSLCNRAAFTSQQALHQHWRNKHADVVQLVEDEGTVSRCRSSDTTLPDDEGGEEEEEEEEEEERQYECGACNELFLTEQSLGQHQRAKGHEGMGGVHSSSSAIPSPVSFSSTPFGSLSMGVLGGVFAVAATGLAVAAYNRSSGSAAQVWSCQRCSTSNLPRQSRCSRCQAEKM